MIDKVFKFSENEINIIGTPDKPWFKAKITAKSLGYKDTDKAIRDHVRDKNKKILSDLLNIFGPANHSGLSYNDLNSIYINEAGLYELIMKSKKEEAIRFQDWVFEEVLPSIRKIGQEKYLEQLQIKDKELEDKEKALKISESKNLQLTTHIKESEQIKIDGWIYIATTKQYSQYNYYKIGSTKSLNPRMNGYQIGRSKQDSYYYVYIYKTSMMGVLETLLKKLLEKFKEDKNREIIVLPWKLLYEYVDYICSNFNDCFIFELNNLIIDNLEFEQSLNKTPEPLDLSKDMIENKEEPDDTLELDSDMTELKIIQDSEIFSDGINGIKCNTCGQLYHRDDYDELPNNVFHTSCKKCVKSRLDRFINDIVFEFNCIKRSKKFKDSKNKEDKERKINKIISELKQLNNNDIYKKAKIIETKNFKRCPHNHINELERWLPKSKFSYDDINKNKLQSFCKDCSH